MLQEALHNQASPRAFSGVGAVDGPCTPPYRSPNIHDGKLHLIGEGLVRTRADDTVLDGVVAPRDRRAAHGRPSAASPAAATLLALQGTAGNRAVASRLSVQRDFDEDFVAKKAEEQKALGTWNTAASGRNQGLIHVVDYAKARPPKKLDEVPPKQDDKLWLAFMAGHPLSGAQLASVFGKEQSDKATITWLNNFTKKLEAFSPPKDVQIAKDLQDHIEARNKAIAETMKTAPDKRAASSSEPVTTLRKEIAELQSQLALKKRWVVGRDDSKKGRVQQVEQAMEKKTGERPNYAGNEILGVTDALAHLITAENTTEKPARGFGEEISATNQWVKTAEATSDKRARWEQKDVTFTGSAYEEESTPDGLRVIKWGPKGETKYSTVMGGSG